MTTTSIVSEFELKLRKEFKKLIAELYIRAITINDATGRDNACPTVIEFPDNHYTLTRIFGKQYSITGINLETCDFMFLFKKNAPIDIWNTPIDALIRFLSKVENIIVEKENEFFK